MHAGQVEVGGSALAAARDDHFGFGGLAQQGLHDRLHRQQLEIHRGIEFIEDHGLVEAAGDGGSGDFPGPLGLDVVDWLLLAAPHDRIAAGAQMIHQVGVALAQGGDGGVFGVAAPPLEPLQDQHPVALVLADAAADRLQGLAQGAGGFALALAGVDLNPIEPPLAGLRLHAVVVAVPGFGTVPILGGPAAVSPHL